MFTAAAVRSCVLEVVTGIHERAFDPAVKYQRRWCDNVRRG
jgi:hypothetical protein